MKLIITLTFFISFLSSFSQTKETVDSIAKEYQDCLDKGQSMGGCARHFLFQMDSLLNVYYRQLRSKCDSSQRENLKDEQLEWLVKRDKTFLRNEKEAEKDAKKEGLSESVEIMFANDKNATTIKERIIQLIKNNPESYSPHKYKVDVTGIYKLDNETAVKNGDTYGYWGTIKVKKISPSKIVLKLFVCKGAPSYNSGVAMDTLIIKDNKAVFTTEDDPSCKLIFTFYRRGIKIEEFTDNINFACGFGHGVVVNGFYKRKYNSIPTDKELREN